jgi:predicted dehydrogenase
MHQEHASEQDVLLYGTEAGASVIGEKLFRNGAGRGEYEVLQSPAADVQWRHASRFHHFIDVALGREPALVTIDEALAVQRILDAIYASAASGREVVFD